MSIEQSSEQELVSRSQEEQYCLQVLVELRLQYERDAKPYLERLTAIRNLMRPSPLILTPDQACEYVDYVASVDGEQR